MKQEEIIKINHLKTAFKINDTYYAAVDDVSLTVNKNEILAIVGESGCGKSTLATSIMGLHNELKTLVEGEIIFENKNLISLSEAEFNTIRGKKIGMIFQDPLSALNPLMRIGDQIEEALIYHTQYTKEERRKIILELVEKVGIQNPDQIIRRFPHQLSGGMRQRIMIAIALSCKPDLLICDEPTTALDVTIQAQILDLIKELQKETGTAVVLITHDLGVVAEIADRVAVMYAGEIVEIANVYELFENPKHPYTRSLLNSIPQLDQNKENLYVIDGTVPSLINLDRKGCRFADRIPWIEESSHEKVPTMHEVAPMHYVQCTCYMNFEFKDGVR